MKDLVLKLWFSSTGKPWCKVTNGSINADGMQFSLNGAPWWGHTGIVAESGNIKRILKVDFSNVKTIINVEG